MKLGICYIKSRLQSNVNVEFRVCRVGRDQMHGKVEPKLQEVNKSIEKAIFH